MSGKKHFHGPGGKKGLARQLAFFGRKYPNGTRSGYPQVKKTPASLDEQAGKSQALANLQQKAAPSAANTESGKETQHDH